MTSTPQTSKGKGKQPSKDWHVHALDKGHNYSPEALNQLWLPFQVYPKIKDSVPATHTDNVKHLTAGQEGAPFTGYYVMLNGAKIAVTNCYGVWFEVCLRGLLFEAFRIARPVLNLHQEAMPGMNGKLLADTGEPLTQPPSCTPTPAPVPAPLVMTTETVAVLMTSLDPPQTPYFDQEERVDPESDEEMPPRHSYDTVAFFSNMARGSHPPHCPWETGDDPFTMGDLDEEERPKSNGWLEGNPPDRFTGDRNKTNKFLTQFKRFMLMNAGACIARNLMACCAYFLLLIDGPKVEGWVEQMYNWLNSVDQIPGLILPGQNAWQVLEGRFKSAFVDYTEDVCAQEGLKKLKMKEGNVDEYIATFKLLGQHAQGGLDNPFLLTHFACGLPKALADACINNKSPETFQEWKAAALCQQKNWMRKQALHREQNPTHPQGQSQGFCGWTWNRPQGQGQEQSQNWQSNQGNCPALPCPHLPPQNNDCMDASATIYKATTDKEKQEYCAAGWCFECRRQGHLAHDCPNKKRTSACTVQIQEGNDLIDLSDNAPATPPPIPLSSNPTRSLAARVACLSEEEHNAFIDKINSLGEKNMGFQNT